MVPGDWRIEFNAKNRRERGDVVFHTPKNNLFFVSWGSLEEARKRFPSLSEQRDKSVGRLKSNPNVANIKLEDNGKMEIRGHEALVSHVTAQGRRGFMTRNPTSQ